MNNGESAVLVIRTNKSDGKWWHTHKLGSVTCKSEPRNDGRFEATVITVSVAKKDRQTKLTKPDRAAARLLGRLSIKVKLGERTELPLRKAMTARNQTCGELAALATSVQLRPSLSLSSEIEPECFRVETTYARSFSVRKRAVSGERGRMKKDTAPKAIVNMPSCKDL